MDKMTKKQPGMKEWAIILAAGALLLILSVPDLFRKEKAETVDAGASVVKSEERTEEYAERMERKLEAMLLKMDGITSAKVMITVKSTTEKVVLQDTLTETETLEERDGDGGSRTSHKTTGDKKTVLDGNTPYLTKELTPEAEGVVAVISGADGSEVLAVSEAIQALFDVPAHKVKIINN